MKLNPKTCNKCLHSFKPGILGRLFGIGEYWCDNSFCKIREVLREDIVEGHIVKETPQMCVNARGSEVWCGKSGKYYAGTMD